MTNETKSALLANPLIEPFLMQLLKAFDSESNTTHQFDIKAELNLLEGLIKSVPESSIEDWAHNVIVSTMSISLYCKSPSISQTSVAIFIYDLDDNYLESCSLTQEGLQTKLSCLGNHFKLAMQQNKYTESYSMAIQIAVTVLRLLNHCLDRKSLMVVH